MTSEAERFGKEYSKKNDKRLYGVWSSMKQRCNNPNDRAYKYYGQKGITVSEEWVSFQEFAKWAYANGYDAESPRGGMHSRQNRFRRKLRA